MLVDPKHHRHFVIRRGQVLREIAEEYGGVMVSFPRSGTQSDKVTLKGAKDCVEAAKKRIQEIIEDLVGVWEGGGALGLNTQGQTEGVAGALRFSASGLRLLPQTAAF